MLVVLENNASRVKRSTSTITRCTTKQSTSFSNATTDILESAYTSVIARRRKPGYTSRANTRSEVASAFPMQFALLFTVSLIMDPFTESGLVRVAAVLFRIQVGITGVCFPSPNFVCCFCPARVVRTVLPNSWKFVGPPPCSPPSRGTRRFAMQKQTSWHT